MIDLRQRRDLAGRSGISKRRRSLAIVTAVFLSNLSIPVTAGTEGGRSSHRKLFTHTEWGNKVFAADAGDEVSLLEAGEPSSPSPMESLAAPSPATPVVPKPVRQSRGTPRPSLALVDFPSLDPVVNRANEPKVGEAPAFARAAHPASAPFSAPLPSVPLEEQADHSASPSEHIVYGYEYPPTIGPTTSRESRPSGAPVGPPSPHTKDRASPTADPAGKSSIGSPSASSDYPSAVPNEAPSEVPSRVPTIVPGKTDPVIKNATMFKDVDELPKTPKASNVLRRGKAGGKGELSKTPKKTKKGKFKSKRCKGKGSSKKGKGSSKKSKVPVMGTKFPSSKSKAPHYCTPTASPYPTVTARPSITPAPTTKENAVLRAACEAIKNRNGNATGYAQSYTVNFILIISDSVNQTIARLENFLQEVVAANMAGCIAEESTNVTNVVFDVYEDEDMPSCATDVPGASCRYLDADAKVYYKDANAARYSASDFYNFLIQFCPDFKNLPGVEKTFDPCSAMDVADNGPAPSAATATQQRSMEGITIGGLISVLLAALFCILVVLVAARRNQKNRYPLKHHPLEEYDDSTYLRDDIDAASRASRRALVFDDEDSIFSGLTSTGARGLDPPSSLANRAHQQDVHVCTSATCEICEKRRQSGLQFVPAVVPSNSSESLSRPRSFVATDTIQL